MNYESKKNMINKMKGIAQKIVSSEAEKHNLDIKIYPLTLVEYYRSDIFKNSFVLVDDQNRKQYCFPAILDALRFRALYRPQQKDIIVFIKGLRKRNACDVEEVYANFITSIYHELKHRYQSYLRKNTKRLDYQTIIFDIEHLVRTEDRNYYLERHDQFYTEIEANLYGVSMALEYLSRNHELTGLQREHLNELKRLYEYKLQNYDLQSLLESFNNAIQNNPNLKIEELYGWLSIFYNSDKTFKSPEEILGDPRVSLLMDEKALNVIITSKPFLESFDFLSLDTEQRQIIIDAVNTNLDLEVAKRKNMQVALKKKRISTSKWLEADTAIASRIVYYMQKKIRFAKIQSKLSKCKIYSK